MSKLNPYNNDSGHIEIATCPLCKKTAQFINDSGVQCVRHFELEAEQDCVNSEFNYFKNAYVTNKKALRHKDATSKELLNALERLVNNSVVRANHPVTCELADEAITNAKQVGGDK